MLLLEISHRGNIQMLLMNFLMSIDDNARDGMRIGRIRS